MNNDEQFVQALGDISEKYCDNLLTSVELSAWIEKDMSDSLRGSTLSKFMDFKEEKSKKAKVFRRSFRRTTKRVRIPLAFCYSNFNNQESIENKNLKKSENLMKKKKFIRFRQSDIQTIDDCEKKFEITSIPFKKPENSRYQSAISKKSSKPETNYDRSFLIMEKSPPTVSGFSVTFYRKNIYKSN